MLIGAGAIGVVLAVATVLSVWLWQLQQPSHDAARSLPTTTAQVIAASDCATADTTAVRLLDLEDPVDAELSGCGFTAGARITVHYDPHDPHRVWYEGTLSATDPGVLLRLLPIGLVWLAALCLVVLVLLLGGHRRGRRARRRRRGADSVTVADLQARLAAGRPAVEPHDATRAAEDR